MYSFLTVPLANSSHSPFARRDVNPIIISPDVSRSRRFAAAKKASSSEHWSFRTAKLTVDFLNPKLVLKYFDQRILPISPRNVDRLDWLWIDTNDKPKAANAYNAARFIYRENFCFIVAMNNLDWHWGHRRLMSVNDVSIEIQMCVFVPKRWESYYILYSISIAYNRARKSDLAIDGGDARF